MNATFSTISRWVTDPGGALVERQKLKRWKREHAIKDPAFWATRDEKAVKAGIKNGKPGTAMMPFAHLPDADVDAIVAYLVANKP